MANLNEFRNRLTGGGARANQFKVDITSPFISDTNALSFLCRSASLPARQLVKCLCFIEVGRFM